MRHLKLGLLAAILLGITAASSANLTIPGSNDVTNNAEIMRGPALAYNGQRRMRWSNVTQRVVVRWPNGVVPVLMSGSLKDRGYLYAVTAMREIEYNTYHGRTYCVRFRNKTAADYGYLEMRFGDSRCSINVNPGYHGRGVNVIHLGGCTHLGDFLQRLVHVLGMVFEHQRPTRDEYVVIHKRNIQDAAKPFFNKYTEEQVDNLLLWSRMRFDFRSITVIRSDLFSKYGKLTITQKYGKKLTRNKYMSRDDVTKLQYLYRCKNDLTHIKGTGLDPNRRAETNCSFSTKEGFCDFQQDPNDDLDWQIGSGSEKGPRAVSPNGKGQFAYVQTEGHSGKIARLTLKKMLRPGKYCFDMDTYGDTNGGGDFKIKSEVKTGVYTIVGTNPKKAKQWQALTFIMFSRSSWKLVLEYTVGTGESSDFAIDKFRLFFGNCPDRGDVIIR